MMGSGGIAVQQAACGPFAFWGRWLVIYKIKSIKDLSLDIINETCCLWREHKRSSTGMGNGVPSKDEDGRGDCVVLFCFHRGLIKRTQVTSIRKAT